MWDSDLAIDAPKPYRRKGFGDSDASDPAAPLGNARPMSSAQGAATQSVRRQHRCGNIDAQAVRRKRALTLTGAPHNESCDLTVAIIIHGDPPHIRRVIESVQAQDYSDGKITILCLDDGTSPQARRLLASMGIRIVDLPKTCCISVAKNTALRIARDIFVLFLDDHICLEASAIAAAMEAFHENPQLAGVCGFYRSVRDTDWNVLRDIKRHSIYGKANKSRLITLCDFTTFSTGLGIVRRDVFVQLDFPADVFPPDFGGEDVPALVTALNQGHEFAYIPDFRGAHEHDLTCRQFLRKMEIEIRGRFSVFYWASGCPELVVPYLHGFLNVPILLFLSVPLSLVVALWQPWALSIPFALFAHECIRSLECMLAPLPYRLRHRGLATCYVLASDLLTPLCGLQYLLSTYKRPFPRLGLARCFRMLAQFLKWELTKLGLYRLRPETRLAGPRSIGEPGGCTIVPADEAAKEVSQRMTHRASELFVVRESEAEADRAETPIRT